jgi:hypothetical protein
MFLGMQSAWKRSRIILSRRRCSTCLRSSMNWSHLSHWPCAKLQHCHGQWLWQWVTTLNMTVTELFLISDWLMMIVSCCLLARINSIDDNADCIILSHICLSPSTWIALENLRWMMNDWLLDRPATKFIWYINKKKHISNSMCRPKNEVDMIWCMTKSSCGCDSDRSTTKRIKIKEQGLNFRVLIWVVVM